MSKVSHVPDLESNAPDDWEVVSSTEESKESAAKPVKKKGFKRWDSGAFLAADTSTIPAESEPSVAVPDWGDAAQKDELLLGMDWGAEPTVESTVLDPDGVKLVGGMLLELVSRLPTQYAPPLPALDAALQGGALLVFQSKEVDLSGIQTFFEQQMDWTEHRFHTFCKPLVLQLTELGYRLRRTHISSTELPGLAQGLIPQDLALESTTESEQGQRMGEPSRPGSSATVERVKRLSSPSVEVPTIAASISADDIPVPIPVGAKESVLVFLLDCVHRSPVRSLLDMDVLREYLEDHLQDMWEQGAFHLQLLWDKLHEIPHLSDALILSVFSEIGKHQKEVHFPIVLPKDVTKDLSKKVVSSVHYRPVDGAVESQKPQARPRPSVERVHAPGKTRKKTSSLFLVSGILVILFGGYYILFVMNAGPSMRGESLDPKRYAALMPLSKVTYHKPSFTMYAKISKEVMQWESAKRVRAIYALHRLTQQQDQVRVLKILKPNGELYAWLGRMN